jgi:hypothetical protein
MMPHYTLKTELCTLKLIFSFYWNARTGKDEADPCCCLTVGGRIDGISASQISLRKWETVGKSLPIILKTGNRR